MHRLEAEYIIGGLYQFENEFHINDVKSWKLRGVICHAYVTQQLLYGVKVWGGSMSKESWTEGD